MLVNVHLKPPLSRDSILTHEMVSELQYPIVSFNQVQRSPHAQDEIEGQGALGEQVPTTIMMIGFRYKNHQE